MKITEFKAWFEGFTENIEGAPTEAQFEKIRAKVAEIDGNPVTERVYLDRYVVPWRRIWDEYWGHQDDLIPRGTCDGTEPYRPDESGIAHIWDPGRNLIRFGAGAGSVTGRQDPGHTLMNSDFDSHSAMRELGRMEAHVS